MNMEFIARANAIILELEKQGLTATAAAMRQVVTDYETNERQAKTEPMTARRFEVTSRI